MDAEDADAGDEPDLENQGLPSAAPGDNSMDEGNAQDGSGQGQGGDPQTVPANTGGQDDAGDMEFAADEQQQKDQEHLPPIDNPQLRRQQKAAQQAAAQAARNEAIRNMTFEEKKKELDAYSPTDDYIKGAYIDAQDTTLNFCMAKVTEVIGNDLQANFDGWSNRWDHVS